VRLGFWQLSRLQQRRAANARTVAAAALPPLQLNDGIGSGNRNGRRAIATGSFDRAHEVVLRGFVYQGAPGVRVVTPLRLAGSDSAVLVLRGFVTADDAVHPNVDSLDEPGELEIRGVLQPVATEPDSGGPLPRGGATTWRRLDLAALRARIPYPILDDYLIADRDSTRHGFPIRLEPAPLDDGPHLSYALQWFGFAITAVVGAVIVAVRGRAQN
jgi:surfeit locus 1 family protein